MTLEIPPWVGSLVLLVVCGAALWKGGREERITAAALFVSVWTTILLRDRSWPHLQQAGFTMDVAMLAVLLVIALRSPKCWPMAAAAFQLLAVVTHLGKMIDPGLHQWAYITAIVIWTYLLMGALGVGTWNAWRARRTGTNRSEAQ